MYKRQSVYRKPGKSLIALGHWPEKGERRRVIAAASPTPPTIDGRLSPDEWDTAARLTGFTLHPSRIHI